MACIIPREGRQTIGSCLAYNLFTEDAIKVGCLLNKTFGEMSRLLCEIRKQETTILLRTLELQHCADIMAEWLLQVVFIFVFM